MSNVPTVLKSDRSVFDEMLPVDDNGFCHFPYGVPCQVWYLIVSGPEFCIPFYFVHTNGIFFLKFSINEMILIYNKFRPNVISISYKLDKFISNLRGVR